MWFGNAFKVRALSAAINGIKTVETKVVDKVFAAKRPSLSGLLAWDVKTGSEGLMKNIRVSAPATVTDGVGRKTVTCEAPRFSDKRLISAGELEGMRAFGSDAGVQLLADRLGDEQYDMRLKVDRTREFMAIRALSGQVVDSAGAVLVDYNLPAAHKPTLGAAAKWTADTSNPVQDLRAWKKLIAQDGGSVTGFTAFAGSDAMDALLNNKAVAELLKYTKGDQLAEAGRVANLAGVTIDEILQSYVDDAGARHDMLPANVFALVGLGPDVAGEIYAPVVDLKANDGVGKGVLPQLFFSKAWEVEDPSGWWLKVESRPLPVLYRPLCVVWAIVV